MPALRKPEVMSPAGYWPQLRAAIEAGADAVYFGLKHFTARAKVGFLAGRTCRRSWRTLHRRGVKGYVTFNTLVFDHELDEAARALAAIAEAGRRRPHRPGRRHRPHGAPDRARPRNSRQHADEHHQRRWRTPGAELRRRPRHPGARIVAGRSARHPPGYRLRTRNLRARRALRRLLRPVLLLRSLGRPQRQSRPVRAGLPPALRDDRGWPAGSRSPTRATCSRPAISTRSRRCRRSSTSASPR